MLSFDSLWGITGLAAGEPKNKMTHETEINDLARRLAAAYVSHFAGYAGVDYLLKSEWMPEKPATVWLNLAEYLYQQRVSPQTKEPSKQ